MTNEIIVLGPWENYDNTEWLVTTYDELDGGQVAVTIDGERVVYPVNSDSVTFFEDTSGKRRTMAEKFVESNYKLMMEITETNSGRIEFEGV